MPNSLISHRNFPFRPFVIYREAGRHRQRTGQFLYNNLPNGAASVVAGTLFDPFHFELNSHEIEKWINDHLILDDADRVIAVFNNNQILWEKEN